jgi:D-xylulose kinase
MVQKFILAHDLGTSGNKSTLISPDGEIIAHTTYQYSTIFLKQHWVEQNPNDWWDAVANASKQLIAEAKIDPKQIACITFSGQMMGAVPVNHKGEAVRNAIIWADMRSAQKTETIAEKIGMKEHYEITGNRLSPSYSAAKINWIQENEPTVHKETFKYLQAKDYIIAKLTGKFATDYSDASGTNLLNIKKKEWSEELIKLWQIDDEKLPEILPSTAVVGEVHSKAAEETGLMPGTPVVMGGADGCCAALGAGAIDEGDIFNYIGSSSWISFSSSRPVFDQEMRTFNFIHLDENKYIPIGTMQAAGTSFQWLRDILFQDVLKTDAAKNIYEMMNEEAESSPIGSNQLIFLPYLMGERSPWWNPNAKGSFIGLTINHKRSDLIRAVLEGISMNLKLIFDALQENYDRPFQDIWLFGGGAKSRIWRQMLADLFGVTIRIPKILDETTSMGAAVAGGVGVGLLKDLTAAKAWCVEAESFEPDQHNHQSYQTALKAFEQVYKQVEPIFNQWNGVE